MADVLEFTKESDNEAASDHLSGKAILGDLIWVKIYDSSWWPAQIVDENAVGGNRKPKNKSAGEVLVRLYGSYEFMYVNPVECLLEFKNILEQHAGSYIDIFEKALEQTKTSKRKRPERTKKEKTEKRKEDGLRKKLKPNCPLSVRVSPRRKLAAAEMKTMENGGKELSGKADGAKSENPNQDGVLKKLVPNTPSKTLKEAEATDSMQKMQELSARRTKIMQTLGLIAPSGSPFNRNGKICPKRPSL